MNRVKSKVKKIAVVDYVGLKGGNHYYSICLLSALYRLGIETFFLSNLEKNEFTSGIYNKKVYPFDLSKNIKGLWALLKGTLVSGFFLRKNRCRHVIFHSFESSLISIVCTSILKLFGLKIIAIIHDIKSFEKEEFSYLRSFQFNKLFDHLVVHNQFSYQSLEEHIPKKNIKKVQIIKHGGHLDVIRKFSKAESRKALKLPDNETIALFFGQIKEVKGLDILIKAFPKQDNLKLYIAGKPWKDDFSKYQYLIDERGLNNHVYLRIEYVNENERDLLYSACDIIILPYKEIYQSGVLLMSMSFQLPVIASDLEANKEIVVHKKNGILFESESVESLNKAINHVIDDKPLMENISRNALETIKHEYSWDTIAENYIQFLE